jgi:acyl-CoA-binding protein
MKAYAEVEKLQLYALLIIALDGVAQSASCPGLFNPRETACYNIWNRRLVGSKGQSEYLEEDSPCSKQKLDEDSSVIQPAAQSL